MNIELFEFLSVIFLKRKMKYNCMRETHLLYAGVVLFSRLAYHFKALGKFEHSKIFIIVLYYLLTHFPLFLFFSFRCEIGNEAQSYIFNDLKITVGRN